jgi:hypothetical protein
MIARNHRGGTQNLNPTLVLFPKGPKATLYQADNDASHSGWSLLACRVFRFVTVERLRECIKLVREKDAP